MGLRDFGGLTMLMVDFRSIGDIPRFMFFLTVQRLHYLYYLGFEIFRKLILCDCGFSFYILYN